MLLRAGLNFTLSAANCYCSSLYLPYFRLAEEELTAENALWEVGFHISRFLITKFEPALIPRLKLF